VASTSSSTRYLPGPTLDPTESEFPGVLKEKIKRIEYYAGLLNLRGKRFGRLIGVRDSRSQIRCRGLRKNQWIDLS